MFADGSNGSIKLEDDVVKIARKGFANVLTQGLQGEKSIPISSIKAVQFKEAGRWMAGYIQFSTVGSIDRRGGMLEVTKDENAVMFAKDQQEDFDKLRAHVETRIAQPENSRGGISPVDELVKLADLVERGFMTREEFDRHKAELLTR